MNIHFYLDDENQNETLITTMSDVESNPFNIGDVVWLNVTELFPSQYDHIGNRNSRNRFMDNQKELEATFNRKEVKLLRVGKYMRFNVLSNPSLTIEYHCEFVF